MLKQSSLSLALFLTFLGCSTTHVVVQKDQNIKIVLDTTTIVQAPGKLLKENSIDLTHIKVYQSLYKLKGHIITYEEAVAQNGYKFQYSIPKTVGLVFSNYRYKKIKSIGSFTFFELHNKNSDEVVYLLVENINKKRLKFLYGMTQDNFYTLLQHIQNKKIIVLDTHNNESYNTQEKNTSIKSSWNFKNIILDTLVEKESRGRRR